MRTLKRIPQKGMIAGVIAGFAEYFQIEVTLLRVLFMFFVICTGFFPGVFGYILAVIIMPIDQPVIHEHKEQTAQNQ